MLIRLVYCSRATQDISFQDIRNVVRIARVNNGLLDVCGMLYYESQCFLQALEGEREIVNELFLEITRDVRHEDVVVVSYDYIDTASFTAWNMGYAASSSAVSAALKEFGLSGFEPEALSPEQAYQVLVMMSQQQTLAAA